MPDVQPEARIAIREETYRIIKQVAALFGIANIAVVLAAIWSFWTFAQAQVGTISTEVKNAVFEELTTSKEELRIAVNEANQLLGRLQERASDLDVLDERLVQIKNRVERLEDEDLVAGASEFLVSWDGSEDVDALVQSLDQKVDVDTSVGCTSPRVFAGAADASSLDWKKYSDNKTAMFVEVDTTNAGFTKTPLYFVSIEGSGSWSAQGVSAVYSRKKDSFRTYLKWSHSSKTNIVDYAAEKNGNSIGLGLAVEA